MRHLRWLVGLVISAVALYVAFVGVEWRQVGTSLAEANYLLVLAVIPIMLAMIAMRAERWRLLFYPRKDIALSSTFGALSVGYMAGNVLPLQLGEVARAYVLGEDEGISKAHVLSTIAVERLIDIVVLLSILGLLIPFVDFPRAALFSAVLILIVAIVAIAVVVFAVVDRQRAGALLERILTLLPAWAAPRLRPIAVSALEGLSALSHLRVVALVLMWTVLSWASSATIIYLVLQAFSIDVPLTAAPFLLVATTFGFFIPSSPGAVGVYDIISIKTLTIVFSVAQEPAATYALVAHALYLLPPTILGAGYLLWRELKSRRARRRGEGGGPEDADMHESAPLGQVRVADLGGVSERHHPT